MKKSEFKSLKSKKPEELEKLVSDKKLEYDKFLVGRAAGSEKNLKKGKLLRRDIAQILTLVRENKI